MSCRESQSFTRIWKDLLRYARICRDSHEFARISMCKDVQGLQGFLLLVGMCGDLHVVNGAESQKTVVRQYARNMRIICAQFRTVSYGGVRIVRVCIDSYGFAWICEQTAHPSTP